MNRTMILHESEHLDTVHQSVECINDEVFWVVSTYSYKDPPQRHMKYPCSHTLDSETADPSQAMFSGIVYCLAAQLRVRMKRLKDGGHGPCSNGHLLTNSHGRASEPRQLDNMRIEE